MGNSTGLRQYYRYGIYSESLLSPPLILILFILLVLGIGGTQCALSIDELIG
jgi:hypothetical protein